MEGGLGGVILAKRSTVHHHSASQWPTAPGRSPGKSSSKWQCILANHLTYGANKIYLVYSEKDFTPFVAAVLKKPASKVTIKLLMDDPARSAQKKQAVSLS
jgi:hypothetical protein